MGDGLCKAAGWAWVLVRRQRTLPTAVLSCLVVPLSLLAARCPPPLQEAAEADDPDSYTPFQFMLQFMLQPLLVACNTTPAGHMAPALIKMCRTLKRTADTAVSGSSVP